MDELEMLLQVVLAIECPLFERSFKARGVVVAVEMGLIWVGFAAVDTHRRLAGPVGVRLRRSTGRAHPFFEGEVEGFLMALPVVFRLERLGAEGALVGIAGLEEAEAAAFLSLCGSAAATTVGGALLLLEGVEGAEGGAGGVRVG
jgi:hypothetical protein